MKRMVRFIRHLFVLRSIPLALWIDEYEAAEGAK